MTRPMTNETAAAAAAAAVVAAGVYAACVDGGVVVVGVGVSKFASLLMQHVHYSNANIMKAMYKHQ